MGAHPYGRLGGAKAHRKIIIGDNATKFKILSYLWQKIFVGLQYILDSEKKKGEGFAQIGYCEFMKTKRTKRKCKSLMTSVTQDVKYRQSLICYTEKHGVAYAVHADVL